MQPEKRAVIHSIHSQVPRTISKLAKRFDIIVSLDSHLDVSLGGDDRLYPKQLRMIARRTGAHTAIRQISGARPPSKSRVIVAIPERMLARHAMDIESSLPRSLRVADGGESIASVMDFLRIERGIEIFQSPPESLSKLVQRTRRAGSWLLDVDVDYMQEMQNECYTRIINPEPGVLQSMENVAEFIMKSNPEIITISEAKVSAIQDPRSNFSTFVNRLKEIGYKIEEGDMVADDAQVVKGISVCKEFYRSVSKTALVRHMDELLKGDFRALEKEERDAARVFFSRKGYGD